LDTFIKSPCTWDDIWIEMAQVISKKSKDLRTKVGCAIVSPDNRKAHFGFNGQPIGIKDTLERLESPEKYKRTIHAETNCIINAKEDLQNWTCYLTMPPCEKCSLMLIQSGISRILYLNEPSSSAFDYNLSYELLKEAGIELKKYQQKGEQ